MTPPLSAEWRVPAERQAHLDHTETPVAPEPASLSFANAPDTWPLSTNFRHTGWATARLRIRNAMTDLMLPGHRIESFTRCGASAWILRHAEDPTLFRTVPDHCHDRWCQPCGHARRAIIQRNLERLLTETPHRFLTLTIRSTGEPLATLLRRLYAAFRLLRTRRLWKERVDGGAAFLEITFNAERGTWHPHLHCMLEGRYLDRPDLSRYWLACTGDSQNVHIQLIRSKRLVIAYVTKYTTKPLPADVISYRPALQEALLALRGRRMLITFGTWKRWRLLDDPGNEGWTVFAHLATIENDAYYGILLACNILAMLPTADPRTGEFTVIYDGPALEDSS